MINRVMSGFNLSSPTWLHIDLNSCFATIEQQANHLYRGKPIAVCAYTTPRGCILAPSIEAKRYGVKTGMQVREGKALCPNLIILPSDPPKYRFVNRALLQLLNEYTPNVSVRSIDEMLLNFSYLNNQSIKQLLRVTRARGSRGELHLSEREGDSGSPRGWQAETSVEAMTPPRWNNLITIAREIKHRIKEEIGEWLTVSIGIATNPYLAKLAAGLHKPDGLDEINQHNILRILSGMELTDLPYIKERNAARLNRAGIKTPLDFYFATGQQLQSAFESVNGHYWYLRLHGYAIDEIEWQRKSIGHQYALPQRTSKKEEVEQLLCKLVEKVGRRLRDNHLTAQGVHLGIGYKEEYWHKGHKFREKMYTNSELFHAAKQLLTQALPLKPVRSLAVTCFSLEENLYTQTALFADELKKRAVTQALDRINDKWGEFSVFPGVMLTVQKQGKILDRIAFGRVLDMEDVVLKENLGWERESYETV